MWNEILNDLVFIECSKEDQEEALKSRTSFPPIVWRADIRDEDIENAIFDKGTVGELAQQRIRERKEATTKIFDELQEEYTKNGSRLNRNDEEKEMRKRLKPVILKISYHRELRKELKLKRGRPLKNLAKINSICYM